MKSLPQPGLADELVMVRPRDELEARILRIWGEALGLSDGEFGVRDEFFSLGGDSIVSIQLSSKLWQQLGVALTIQDIFRYKTVEGLASYIRTLPQDDVAHIKAEQGILTGDFNLLPVQSWFFANKFALPNHWNQAFVINTPNLDGTKLKTCILELINHHDVLRLAFRDRQQVYGGQESEVHLNVLDVTTLGCVEDSPEFEAALQDVFTTWQGSFDLAAGRLYCFGYVHGFRDKRAKVFLALHHLLSDTVSIQILSQHLRSLYLGHKLPAKTTSYRQWVRAIEEYAAHNPMEAAQWNDVLRDFDPSNLECLASAQEFHSATIALSANLTHRLLTKANQAYHTQINDLLLTAVAYALADAGKSAVNH